MNTIPRSLLTVAAGAALLAASSVASAASLTGLGDLSGGGFISHAYGVNADGSVIVGASYSGLGREAFRGPTPTAWSAWATSPTAASKASPTA